MSRIDEHNLANEGGLENACPDIEFLAEMDRRVKEYESGKAKLFTLDEMENNARAAYIANKKNKNFLHGVDIIPDFPSIHNIGKGSLE